MSATIRSGDLNRLVTVQQRSTTTDSFGGQVNTWSDVKSVYAKITALGGRELLAAQSYSTDVSHQILVRYDAIFADPRVVAAYRISYASRLFNIFAALNENEENRVVTLIAAEGLNNG